MAVAGLGKCRCCCHSGFGPGRLGDFCLGDRCLGRRSRGFHRRIRRRLCTGLTRSRVGATSSLACAIPRHLAAGCNWLPRRGGGAIRLNHHMRGHGPISVHHTGSTKGSARRRHKVRGHERSALAGNAGIRTGYIQPGRIHDKRLARNVSPEPLVEQAHAIKAQASIGTRARGSSAPSTTYCQAACGNAGNSLVCFVKRI